MQKNHSFVLLKYPNIEILLCRRDIIDVWELQNLKMPYWRIYCPYNECGKISYRNDTFTMRPGNVYLIALETDFSSSTSGGKVEKLYLHFVVDKEYGNCADHIFTFPVDTSIQGLADKVSDKLLKYQNDSELSMGAVALCSCLLAKIPSEHLFQQQHTDENLLKIWHLLKDNPRQKYTNEKLAQMMNLSVNAFIRKFFVAFGIAPQQFVLKERLRMASMLLVNSNLSIDEIADLSGFCDRFYFSKMFTKYRGVSPAAFRKCDSRESL